MDRIININSIQINVSKDGVVETKIIRKDGVIEDITFKLSDVEKRETMNEFLKVFQMHDITAVTFDGVEL